MTYPVSARMRTLPRPQKLQLSGAGSELSGVKTFQFDELTVGILCWWYHARISSKYLREPVSQRNRDLWSGWLLR